MTITVFKRTESTIVFETVGERRFWEVAYTAALANPSLVMSAKEYADTSVRERRLRSAALETQK